LGHIVISVPPKGGPRSQISGENRGPPSGSLSETNNDCQVKFELIQIIVALARKLLIALWRYTTAGVVIEGALMKAAQATI
jgi:hypothetical protein